MDLFDLVVLFRKNILFLITDFKGFLTVFATSVSSLSLKGSANDDDDYVFVLVRDLL